MSIQPDFKKAAYHINRVVNGLAAQWCDEPEQDAAAFACDLDALRAELLPWLEDAHVPMARALGDALQAVTDGKDSAPAIVSEGLSRVGREIPEIAAYRVSFGEYCHALGENRANAYVGKAWRDPNLRVG
jgi:hypothetical protein